MANSWLRLWHDMPNDPKWRTIARVSKQSIPAVLSVYVHLLVIASNATERGRTQNVCSEDLASALDLEAEQVEAILAAMQGRVLDGDIVSGWEKRQVGREDGSAERAKRWREAKKEAKQTQPNATERKRAPDTDTDTDTDTEEKKEQNLAPEKPARFDPLKIDLPECIKPDAWASWISYRRERKLTMRQTTMVAQVAELAGWFASGHDPAKIIQTSIAKGWAGLFEPKQQGAPPLGNATNTERDRIAEEIWGKQNGRNDGITTIHGTAERVG